MERDFKLGHRHTIDNSIGWLNYLKSLPKVEGDRKLAEWDRVRLELLKEEEREDYGEPVTLADPASGQDGPFQHVLAIDVWSKMLDACSPVVTGPVTGQQAACEEVSQINYVFEHDGDIP